jgi:hypothetical protein
MLARLLALCATMHLFWALTFLILRPLTGYVVAQTQGPTPRHLRLHARSKFNRLVEAAVHINDVEWKVFCRANKLVNSLLKWPLRVEPTHSQDWIRTAFELALRCLILGQWIIAIATAAQMIWDAYIVAFWILLCIVTQSYLIPADVSVRTWMHNEAKLRLDRHEVQLSGRRALEHDRGAESRQVQFGG